MKSKRLVIAPLGLGIMALLAACGAAKQAIPAAPTASQASPARAVGAPAIAGAPVQVQAQANSASKPVQQQFQGAAPLEPLPPVNRMIIKNGSLSISVDDPEASLGVVDDLVKAEQGSIVSQNVRTQNDKTFVNMVIQVGPDNFEETLAKLRDLRAQGTRVLSDSASSQDVTEQYVDLDAQYRNLQATRDAYQKLLDKATAVSDIITLTREVAGIQTQMDQIKGRQNLLSRESAISTINLSLSPIGAAPLPNPRPLPRPAQAAQQAWQALLVGLQGLAVVLIWMAILLPIPAVALGVGCVIFRRMSRGQPQPYQAEGTKN